MTVYTDRGSGTPATTGTTWATVTNAVDGNPGTNPATYATMTSTTASAVATIEVTGYDFSTVIAATDTLNSVQVTLRHFENNTGRFTSVTMQPFDGATSIGTAQTCTLATAARDDTFTFAATLTQLRSATFKVRVTITGAASTQSRVESIDHIDVAADYTVVPPSITQAAYRFYADGTETGSTALATENTAYTADVTAGDVNLLIRTRLQLTTAVATTGTDDWQLQWEKNASGTWNYVNGLSDFYDESNVSFTNDIMLTAGLGVGQSFMGNGQKLSRVGYWLNKVGVPPGNLAATLYAHTGTYGTTGGTGTGSVLATSTTKLATSLSTTLQWEYFDFDGTVTLTAGTPYVFLITSDTVEPNSSNTVKEGYDGSSPTHPGSAQQRTSGGVWTSQTTTDKVFQIYTTVPAAPYASANLTDGAATTNRLTAGTGSFVAGKVSEDGVVDDLGWTASNYTEVLYAVTLKQANLANSDTLRFRVLRNGATTEMTYTQTPTINVTKTVTTTGQPKVYLSGAFTKKPLKVWSGSAWNTKPVKVWTGSTWKTLT